MEGFIPLLWDAFWMLWNVALIISPQPLNYTVAAFCPVNEYRNQVADCSHHSQGYDCLTDRVSEHCIGRLGFYYLKAFIQYGAAQCKNQHGCEYGICVPLYEQHSIDLFPSHADTLQKASSLPLLLTLTYIILIKFIKPIPSKITLSAFPRKVIPPKLALSSLIFSTFDVIPTPL